MKTIIIILVSILVGNAKAQFQVNWISNYGGPGMTFDRGNVVKTDAEGSIYVGGFIRTGSFIGSEDFCMLKYESDGQLAWERSYNGPGEYIDLISDMEIDESGNVYVTGQSFGNNSYYDFCTIKYDREGNLKWARRYDNSSGNDEAMKIIRTSSNYIYVSGISENTQEDFDICLIKYSVYGTEQWVRRYDGSGVDILSAMAQDNYGNIYLSGYTYNDINKYDICLLKYSPEGNLIYAEKFDRGYHENDVAHSMTINNTGEVYLAGRSKNSKGDYDCTLLKYGANGNLIWERFYNGTGNDYDQASSVCVDKYNDVIITGWSWGNSTSDDFITIKYNPDGDQMWTKTYDNSDNGESTSDGADKIICDYEGNLYIMGVSNNDYLLIRYDPSGSMVYQFRFDGEIHGLEEPKDMCFDKNNSILITGMSEHYSENTDICTIKINNSITAVHTQNNNAPEKFSLGQNYPNPFNPATSIKYSIPGSSFVTLKVYDMLGKEVATLVNNIVSAGIHESIWDASKYTSGTYFYKLTSEEHSETKRMVLIK